MRCRRVSVRRIAPSSMRLDVSRCDRKRSSMRSTSTLVRRMIWISRSAWSRSRCTSSSAGDLNRSPSRTHARSVSTERSGLSRAVTMMRCSTCTNSVAISDGVNSRLNITSLTIARSAPSSCSMRVERDPSWRNSKKLSGRPRCVRIQRSLAPCARLKCSQTKSPDPPAPCSRHVRSHAAAESASSVAPAPPGTKRKPHTMPDVSAP